MTRFCCILLLPLALTAHAQAAHSALPPVNWQLLDWQQDGYPGLSVEKAYATLLRHKKPLKRIVVAVVDDGLASTPADLAGVQWTNTNEIAGNGRDDDHNGYVDDVHGWNFVGNDRQETFEEVREYVRLRGEFENRPDSVAVKADPRYAYWQTIVAAKNKQLRTLRETIAWMGKITAAFQTLQAYWSSRLASQVVPFGRITQDAATYSGAAAPVLAARSFLLSFRENTKGTADSTRLTLIMREAQSYADAAAQALSVADTVLQKNDAGYFRRRYLQDDPYTNSRKGYGNGNVEPDDTHGTKCAGVIAAWRHNHLGSDGITNSVAIMPVRVNAMGHLSDEWDKDVANAIRYAVDNGAQVVSLSFGKYYSPQQQWVREAVAYAEKKGVLLVHAAMNDALNTDSLASYPQEYYSDKHRALNLLTVGASTYDASLVAAFSNYGSRTVDVFAPGVAIYLPLPKGGYERSQGTSFACPMVAGVAALLWSYYPQFTYRQIRECIEQSVTPLSVRVTKPGTKLSVPFCSLSRTGGIINAYKALTVAARLAGGP